MEIQPWHGYVILDVRYMCIFQVHLIGITNLSRVSMELI